MALHRCPLLVWRDHEGLFTAAPIHLMSDLAGNAETAGAAIQQVKSYLAHYFRADPHAHTPEMLDPQLVHVPVSIRPEYETRDRKYPCNERVEIRVTGVNWRSSHGVYVGTVPMLGVHFHYYDAKMFKRLVRERVRNQLAGATPRQLVRLLAPAEAWLDEVLVKTPSHRGGEPQWDDALVPTLSSIAEPVNRRGTKRRGRAWQRERAISRLATLIGKERANVVLVGESGVGKSTLLAAAVRQAERDFSSDPAAASSVGCPYRFWTTSAGHLIAGMQYLGQWEERCETVIAELSSIDGTLCVENLLELVTQGGLSATDSLAAFLSPYLDHGELAMVAEISPAELDTCRRLLPGFADIFQVFPVEALSPSDTRIALGKLIEVEGQRGQVAGEPTAIDTIDRMFRRFMPYHSLPGKAVPFVQTLVTDAIKNRAQRITVQDVIRLFIQQTGLPEVFIRDEMTLPVDSVVEYFSSRVIGQDDACQAVTSIVTTFKSGLNDPARPLGVLLFCGPTGVGKTEMAKAVGDYFFGAGQNTQHFIRLDMSEYSLPGSGDRLLSQADRSPSELLAKIRQQPFAVILLDEIEKASDDVYDVLLGLFDEGRLTDHQGRTACFQSAVIIMTSNLGTTSQASIGFDRDKTPSYEAEVRSFFRPEFFNRIDRVVRFNALDNDTCRAIVRRELTSVFRREGVTKRGLRIEPSQRLVEWLLQSGFDDRLGARPLQRLIESRVVARLSRYLISDSDLRDAELRLDFESGEVTFRKEKIGTEDGTEPPSGGTNEPRSGGST